LRGQWAMLVRVRVPLSAPSFLFKLSRILLQNNSKPL
jgi:hypothetical protein